jgi:hypothetical protein
MAGILIPMMNHHPKTAAAIYSCSTSAVDDEFDRTSISLFLAGRRTAVVGSIKIILHGTSRHDIMLHPCPVR